MRMAATLSIECDKTILASEQNAKRCYMYVLCHTQRKWLKCRLKHLQLQTFFSIDMFFNLLCVYISQNLIHKARAKAMEEKRREHITGKMQREEKKNINSKCMAYARSHRSLGSTFSFAFDVGYANNRMQHIYLIC